MTTIATRIPDVRCLAAVALLGLVGSAHAASGCPWISATGSTDRGIVDTNAAYWSSVMPAYVQPGTTVQIYGTWPQLRFFNFTVYHGGKMIDYLSDANLYPVEGGTPNANLSALPDFDLLQDHYLITIKYEDAPAVREPNTLYVGSSTSLQRLLLMRDYLPNAGVDSTGGVGLPTLTKFNPDGSSERYDSASSNVACPLVDAISTALYQIQPTQVGFASRNPVFNILPQSDYNIGGGLFPPYSNFDAGYGGLMASPTYGDLLLIRSQMPLTPSTTTDPDSVQARYFSVCAYHATDRMQLGCLTDAQMVTQTDGYSTIVLSTTADRPPMANPADGYNWMAWDNSTDRQSFTIRELLPNPGFAGSYLNASDASDPIAALGDWAPLTTYCSTQTFNANAANGGAAVFAACKAANASVKSGR